MPAFLLLKYSNLSIHVLRQCPQTLIEPALVASGGIFMYQPFACQTIDNGGRFAERLLCRGLVLGGDRGADFLDPAAQFCTLAGVAGAVDFRLARAFLCLCCIGQNRSPESVLKSAPLC